MVDSGINRMICRWGIKIEMESGFLASAKKELYLFLRRCY